MRTQADLLREEMELEDVVFSMKDEHAAYYFATCEGESLEIKVEYEDLAVSARDIDSEDWDYWDHLEEDVA